MLLSFSPLNIKPYALFRILVRLLSQEIADTGQALLLNILTPLTLFTRCFTVVLSKENTTFSGRCRQRNVTQLMGH